MLDPLNRIPFRLSRDSNFSKEAGGPDDWPLNAKGPKGRAQIMERFTKIPIQVEARVRDVVVVFIDQSHVESPHNVADPFFDILTLSCLCAPPGWRNRLVDGVVISGPLNGAFDSKRKTSICSIGKRTGQGLRKIESKGLADSARAIDFIDHQFGADAVHSHTAAGDSNLSGPRTRSMSPMDRNLPFAVRHDYVVVQCRNGSICLELDGVVVFLR